MKKFVVMSIFLATFKPVFAADPVSSTPAATPAAESKSGIPVSPLPKSKLDEIKERAELQNAVVEELEATAKAVAKEQEINKYSNGVNYGVPKVKAVRGTDALKATLIFDDGGFSEYGSGDVLPNGMVVTTVRPGDVRVKNNKGKIIRLLYVSGTTTTSNVGAR